MKKICALGLALLLALSLAACAAKVKLISNQAGDLSIGLPEDVLLVQTSQDTGATIFSDEEKTGVLTVSSKISEPTKPEDFTDEKMEEQLGASLTDLVYTSGGTSEKNGLTSVVGSAVGVLNNGSSVEMTLQYLFPEDGSGFYAITYICQTDVENTLRSGLEAVIKSVKLGE